MANTKKASSNTDKAAPSAGELVVYQADDGRVKVEVRLQDESVWLTPQLMAALFQTTRQNVILHISNIYKEGELLPEATCKDFLQVRQEGERAVQRKLTYYNLDMIISVGYRVKSLVATRFRIWATQKLKEYIIKGFVLDDERLKNPPVAGSSSLPDYFDELLERIRDIRASERRMYLRVREIFALAGDYDPSGTGTTKFFSVIQNKLLFAATGQTAAELIHSRADHRKPQMGLTTWQGGEVRASDVTVAKNYLAEGEIDGLNRIVVMWLDYAEDQATRRKQVFMKDWQSKLDEFLKFNERKVLTDSGRISKKKADDRAKDEYGLYATRRRAEKEAVGEAEMMKELEELARQGRNGARRG
ncbi:MAG: virulence RhuM family protein [Candidatus Adiutrix sp.]|jgi:hypothetical protein|nr:virulence RhuM family protein [Candidatus Adiutrix sp.]